MLNQFKWFLPPTGFCLSTEEWVRHARLRYGKASYTRFNFAHTASYLEPKGLDHTAHWKFMEEQKRRPPPTFLAVIPGGRVWGATGAVISPDNKLLWDLSIHYNITGKAIPEFHPIFYLNYLPPVQSREKAVAVLTFGASRYYYHWMFDVLPRLHLLRRQNMAGHSIIMNFSSLPFQEETLALLKIPGAQIIACHRQLHLQAGKLIVPSLAGYTGHMPKWTCDFLRKEFLSKINTAKIPGYERIYISRRNARNRKVLNEDKVMELLSKYGFKQVALEFMPVTEQIRLFLGAEAIVSAHGGGLANLVFCRPGTKVLECFSPYYVNVLYWFLSNHVNLDYHYLIGEGERPADYEDPFMVWDHVSINLGQLKDMLKMMGM